MNSYKNYLEDCLEHLIDRSIEAKVKADETNDAFDQGLSFGYYEVLSHLLAQSEIFEIKETFKEKIKTFSPAF